jgi:hypothetical protein
MGTTTNMDYVNEKCQYLPCVIFEAIFDFFFFLSVQFTFGQGYIHENRGNESGIHYVCLQWCCNDEIKLTATILQANLGYEVVIDPQTVTSM